MQTSKLGKIETQQDNVVYGAAILFTRHPT